MRSILAGTLGGGGAIVVARFVDGFLGGIVAGLVTGAVIGAVVSYAMRPKGGV